MKSGIALSMDYHHDIIDSLLILWENNQITIIVTGGAGFIGSNFVFHMLDAHPEYRIICIDKLTYAGNLSTLASLLDPAAPDYDAAKASRFRFCKVDICDREAVEKVFKEEKPDVVVNFAAESHVDRSIENPGIFPETNIMGTQVMMDACRRRSSRMV